MSYEDSVSPTDTATIPRSLKARFRAARLGRNGVHYRELVTLSVLHLSTTGAAGGGAGRAAQALHEAMVQQGVSSHLITAKGPRFATAKWADRQLWRIQRSPVETWRSPAVFGTFSAKDINSHPADVVNLHWITNGFLSIKEIGRIEKPIVWSLYDMWAFCGTEHYGVDSPSARWIGGYTPESRPSRESGLDLDRYIWNRKLRHWQPTQVVPASTWLASRVGQSALMGSWPTTQIPHVIDTQQFLPQEHDCARERLSITSSDPIILFLSSAGIHDARKGFDLLEKALPTVKRSVPNVQLIVVGPLAHGSSHVGGVPVTWFGPATSNSELRDLYSAANVTAVPSREDNMPLTAMEAQTCGRPVVAFNVGGLPDIVQHVETGYVAEPGDLAAFAQGLIRAVADPAAASSWGLRARARAIQSWSAPVVVERYLEVYRSAARKQQFIQ